MNTATVHWDQILWFGLLLPILCTVGCLYAWGGICFAWFRFAETETRACCCTFLYNKFLSARYPLRFLRGPRRVTRADARRFGYGAWTMVGLPFIALQSGHLAAWAVVLANGMLFFGGLFLATSWYARRCLRLLGVDSLGKEEALAGMGIEKRKPPQASWALAFLSASAHSIGTLRQRGSETFSAWSGQ